MLNNENKIVCPSCSFEIDVHESLSQKYKKELDIERKKFEDEKKTYDEKIKLSVEKLMKTEKEQLESKLKKDLEEENSERIKNLESELNEKSQKVKDFNKAQSEIEKLKREKNELKESIEAESEKKINQVIEKIKKESEEKFELKFKEQQKKYDDLNDKLKETQRKAEQGSVQLQGEIQEIAIEEWLKTKFYEDTIAEVPKGKKGADCVQIVNTISRKNCGRICFESKRTKSFSSAWIQKIKSDMKDVRADIGVIVTEVLPQDMERMGIKEGIWICTFQEFKGLCLALRESIVKVSESISIQENKGEKMTMLYNYLTGNQFRMQLESIVESFSSMKSNLDLEKRNAIKNWKVRETEIEKVLLNTIDMYSSIKGIVGTSIKNIDLLELQDSDNKESDNKK